MEAKVDTKKPNIYQNFFAENLLPRLKLGMFYVK